jgi:general secretion pathway protein N
MERYKVTSRIPILFMGAVAAFLLVVWSDAPTLAAINPPVLDPSESDVGLPRTLDLDPQPPAAEVTPAPRRELSGNPLWAIPLKSLVATRERPIFLPSRRAPAPAVANAPFVEIAKPSIQPTRTEPERPPLTLVGAITGSNEGFAVFVDDTTHDIVRLKTGEGHEGWVLRSVDGREVTLEKGRQSAVLALPAPSEERK